MRPDAVSLIDLPLYDMAQVDRLLCLPPGTARRWIDGYERRGRIYPPVVRQESTGDNTVTWGEFVEARLLAEFRIAGVPIVRMRPAISRLRDEFHSRYPLAHARPFLHVDGKELVLRIQREAELDPSLALVVVRNNQLILTDAAERFCRSAEFGDEDGVVRRLKPLPEIAEVVIDPLRQFGEPVLRDRGVRTEVIAEQIAAGESMAAIARLYDLTEQQVEAALAFERARSIVAA
jgi:uncharacterized protein (DUF433 family)